MLPSHEDFLQVLANPTTRNILEKFGLEYSVAGFSDFRARKPEIVASLVRAIIAELSIHPIFPPSARECLPQQGLYIISQPDGFEVTVTEKPSVSDSFLHATAEGAARSYVYKLFDPYWLQFDHVMVHFRK